MSSSALGTRLAEVDGSIADAARSAGRDVADITRIVVTKFHPASLVRELHALGVRDVAENRQQELQSKSAELEGLDEVRWHFVGQVQSKKARAVRRAASVVHSVDREKLVSALDAPGRIRSTCSCRSTSPRIRTAGAFAMTTRRGSRRRSRDRIFAPARRDGGRPARRGSRSRIRAPRGHRGARASGRSGRALDLRGHVRRLRRGDQPRCDTPAHRHGNHGPAALTGLAFCKTSTHHPGGRNGEPA